MKKISIFIASMFFTTNIALAGDFIIGMEDIPLADGFVQIESEQISFGNEASRFVEAYITKEFAKKEEAQNFYLETLPQLGWKKNKNGKKSVSFERKDEEIEIGTEQTNPLIIRITLKSKGM